MHITFLSPLPVQNWFRNSGRVVFFCLCAVKSEDLLCAMRRSAHEPGLRFDGPAVLDPVVRRAFNRDPLVPRILLDRGSDLGDTSRLQRKLLAGQPVTLAALGSSNVVRGGCQLWQDPARLKCGHPKHTNRSADDGTAQGWLLQGFEALNATCGGVPSV